MNTIAHWHTVQHGETLWAIAKRFAISPHTLRSANNIKSDRQCRPGKNLFIPTDTPPLVEARSVPDTPRKPPRFPKSKFQSPIKSKPTLSSPYGYRRHPLTHIVTFHHGIDLAMKPNTPIYPMLHGMVIRTGIARGYGKLIIIEHREGYTTRYAHLSKIQVKVGQQVTPQQVIALSGNTGRTTAPHLHFEIRINGNSIDPTPHFFRNFPKIISK